MIPGAMRPLPALTRQLPLLLTLLMVPAAQAATVAARQEEERGQPGSSSEDEAETPDGDGRESRARLWERKRLEKSRQPEPEPQSGLEKSLLYVEERGLENLKLRYGDFHARFASLSTGSGLAPGVRYWRPVLGETGLSFQASAAYSLRGYQLYDLQFGSFNQTAADPLTEPGLVGGPLLFTDEGRRGRRLVVYGDLAYRYSPREDFFGLGGDSAKGDRTSYLYESMSYDAVAGYRFTPVLGAVVRGGVVRVDTGPGTDPRFPRLHEVFDEAAAPGLTRQPSFARIDSTLYLDTRDRPGNPHAGGLLALSLAAFDDLNGNEFRFSRVSLDTRQFIPLGSEQRVLALRFWTSVDNAGKGAQVPFYFQRTLGGSETLRGFREFRFRDENLLHLSAEYRWEAAPAVELALFYDAGKVFDSGGDFDLTGLKKSLGLGVRFKTPQGVFLRIDSARSPEGTRVFFRFGPSF
jgi:hypothetical protein